MCDVIAGAGIRTNRVGRTNLVSPPAAAEDPAAAANRIFQQSSVNTANSERHNLTSIIGSSCDSHSNSLWRHQIRCDAEDLEVG